MTVKHYLLKQFEIFYPQIEGARLSRLPYNIIYLINLNNVNLRPFVSHLIFKRSMAIHDKDAIWLFNLNNDTTLQIFNLFINF